MNIEKLKQLVKFRVMLHPEDIPIEGNASAIDEETDKKIADNIRKQLESGNDWAWCCVQVDAVFGDYVGTDYLGRCSYESQKEFEQNSGYYEDMKDQAFSCLVDVIDSAKKQLLEIE